MREALPLWRETVFVLRAHLAEGDVETVRTEQRVIAKAPVAPWQPYDDSVDATFEGFNVTVRPCEAESGDKMSTPPVRSSRALLDQQGLDAVHGRAKIPVGAGPARGMYAGLTAQRIDDQS